MYFQNQPNKNIALISKDGIELLGLDFQNNVELRAIATSGNVTYTIWITPVKGTEFYIAVDSSKSISLYREKQLKKLFKRQKKRPRARRWRTTLTELEKQTVAWWDKNGLPRCTRKPD